MDTIPESGADVPRSLLESYPVQESPSPGRYPPRCHLCLIAQLPWDECGHLHSFPEGTSLVLIACNKFAHLPLTRARTVWRACTDQRTLHPNRAHAPTLMISRRAPLTLGLCTALGRTMVKASLSTPTNLHRERISAPFSQERTRRVRSLHLSTGKGPLWAQAGLSVKKSGVQLEMVDIVLMRRTV